MELALYMFPRFLESLFRYLEGKGLVKPLANGEVLVIALAFGIIMRYQKVLALCSCNPIIIGDCVSGIGFSVSKSLESPVSLEA